MNITAEYESLEILPAGKGPDMVLIQQIQAWGLLANLIIIPKNLIKKKREKKQEKTTIGLINVCFPAPKPPQKPKLPSPSVDKNSIRFFPRIRGHEDEVYYDDDD